MNAFEPPSYVALPFLNGVYIAVDAIRGSYLVVDGPYCVFTKAEMQYCHNLRCRLLPPLGHTRIVHTGQVEGREEVQGLSADRRARVEEVLSAVCARKDAELVLATSFDFHALLGFPLRELARRARGGASGLVCHVPSKSLGGDWLDGYAGVCETLARELPLPRGGRAKGTVALVGYLHDRDEPDHAGNLRELRRLLGALGLRVVSVWLSGGGCRELAAASRAETILSFPYAREAARILARRTGARLCEVELPIGLEGTERFLLRAARFCGRTARARRFAADERARAVRDTERHVLRLIAGHPAIFEQNDPHLEAALRGLCAELGMLDFSPKEAGRSQTGMVPVSFAPSAARDRRCVHVPMGYPNYLDHPVVERPFMGYAGFRCLVDRIASAALGAEAETH